MKDFLKAYKLYFKTTLSRGSAVGGIILMLICFGCALLFGVAYKMENMLSLNYLMGGCLFHRFVNLKSATVTQNKFFLSMKNAKQFYTVIPIAVVGSVYLVFDFICFGLSLCLFGGKVAGDLLIIYSVSTIIVTLGQITDNVPKLSFISLFSLLGLMIFNPAGVICDLGYKRGIGLPVYVDILISLGNYIVGAALIIGIMTLWWNKSGRSIEFVENDIWGFRKRRR